MKEMEDSVTETEKLVVYSSKNDVEKEEKIGGKTEEKEEEEMPGGFIHQLFSNLAPAGTEKQDEEHGKGDAEVGGEAGDKEKGGLFSNMISNLVSPSSTPRVKESGGEFDGHEQEKQCEYSGKSGGIIDNLVSHLPKPLLEDVAPEPDEASNSNSLHCP